MQYRTRIFLDFWNFQLTWNFKTLDQESGESERCDWKAVPRVLAQGAASVLSAIDPEAIVNLEGDTRSCFLQPRQGVRSEPEGLA